MTRKDYVKFANIIKSEVDLLKDNSTINEAKRLVIFRIAISMSKIFRQDNSNYNSSRFLDACSL